VALKKLGSAAAVIFFLSQLRPWFWLGFMQYLIIPSWIMSLVTCWRMDLHLYWVLRLTVPMTDSQSN
jgi:hypothetical protein